MTRINKEMFIDTDQTNGLVLYHRVVDSNLFEREREVLLPPTSDFYYWWKDRRGKTAIKLSSWVLFWM